MMVLIVATTQPKRSSQFQPGDIAPTPPLAGQPGIRTQRPAEDDISRQQHSTPDSVGTYFVDVSKIPTESVEANFENRDSSLLML